MRGCNVRRPFGASRRDIGRCREHPAGGGVAVRPDPVAADDSSIASILFTSGTTIAPKAVPLTHRNLLANASALLRVHPIRPADEMLSVLPPYHAFEFTGGFLVPMVCGATVTYVDQLKGAEILAAMQATGTTIVLAVPRLLKMFYDSIEGGVASSGLLRRGLFRLLGFASDLTAHRFGRRLFRVVHKVPGGADVRQRRLRLDPELFRRSAMGSSSTRIRADRPRRCSPSIRPDHQGGVGPSAAAQRRTASATASKESLCGRGRRHVRLHRRFESTPVMIRRATGRQP